MSAAEIIAAEITREGPIPFRRFMETALYHPDYGYYRSRRDPFGKHGDFYTAEQIQPVFGILIGAMVRELLAGTGSRTVIELGAGREEMAPAFDGLEYIAVDIDRGVLPERFSGVVFANEFFDALPVDVYRRRGGEFVEQRVGFSGGRFHWVTGGADGDVVERSPAAIDWSGRIAGAMERGHVLAIDYGYTERELMRFPQGTLMSYRRHTALEDVLAEPGLRDITAHVDFTALEQAARAAGFGTVRFETLAQTLMRIGERDQFAAALAGVDERECLRRRQQLKTLLFGMGETFRVLLLARSTQ